MVALSQVMLLLLISSASAQVVEVTASPSAIADPSKPGPVILHVTKTDDTALDATAFSNQLGSVKVGGRDVVSSFDPTKADITITPPQNLVGAQKVELFDKSNPPQPLGETQLQYAGAATSTPTPTPDRIENRRDALMNSNWYYAIVSILFASLLVPFGVTISHVIRFSRSSFRNPLGFPVGSFRAILAYTLVAYLGFFILTGVLSVAPFEPPEFLLGIVATVVGFYFGSRTGEEGTADPNAGIVRGVVRVGTNPARGVLVKFKRDDGTEPYSRITDVEGQFGLQGARAGKYKVTATVNTSTASQDITVGEGSDQEVELLIKAPGSSTPSATATLEGKVTKAADSSAVANADVVLTQNSAEKGRAKTDASGKYKLENIAFGDYKIVASAAGVSSNVKNVSVTTASVTGIDLQI
jgi:hypothetical protein